LPDAPALENFAPGKRTGEFSPGEKGQTHIGDPQVRQNPEGGEELWRNVKALEKGGPANFDSEFSARDKDLFLKELKLSEISSPGNPRTESLAFHPVPPAERSEALRPAGETRFEGPLGASQSRKADVSEQISQKMVWSLGQNEEKFRLTLDPPHLGSIYLEIQRDKEQVKATLWAENPNTKQILESNQISIQRIIETEGFSLESFNVFVEQDLSAFQESRERMLRSPEAQASNPPVEVKGELGGGSTAPALLGKRSGGGLHAIDLII
jgi:hypothetical protein